MALAKPSFLRKKFAKHTVGDEELNFYGLRVQVLADLRGMSKPIARAFTTLFSVGHGSRARAEKNFKEPKQFRLERTSDEGDKVLFEDVAVVNTGEETVQEAMTIEMSTHLLDQRSAAVGEMIDTFTDPANRHVVGKAIMASLRDHYPKLRELTAVEIQRFMEGDDDDPENYPGVDTPTLLQLLIGMCKANFSWFAEAEGKIRAAVEKKLEKVLKATEDDPEDLPPGGEASA